MGLSAMNWFQARNLAISRGYAVRRAGWKRWLYRPKFTWRCFDFSEGLGAARVVRSTDFGNVDRLSKDWTTEPWEGGALPPCCNPVVATEFAPNVSGGLASWTRTPQKCDGAGTGGNVPAISTVIDVGEAGEDPEEDYSIELRFVLRTAMNTPVVPTGPGGLSWNSVPESGVVLQARLYPRTDSPFVVLYIAPPGETLSGIPEGGIVATGSYTNQGGQLGYGSYTLVEGLIRAHFQPGYTGNPDGWVSFGDYPPQTIQELYGNPTGASWNGQLPLVRRQNGQNSLVEITPGSTWTAKAYFVQSVGALGAIDSKLVINESAPVYEGSYTEKPWWEEGGGY